MKKLSLILIGISLFLASFSQYEKKQIEVFNGDIVVNSRSSVDGYTRYFISINLPDNCYGYVYRTTIKEIGQTRLQSSLIEAIKLIPDSRVKMGVEIGELVAPLVNPMLNGERIDLYVMDNISDVTNFYKRQGFNSCNSYKKIGNSCYTSSLCVGRRIFFGLKNNNFSEGLTVKLEVAALVIVPPKKINTSNPDTIKQIFNDIFNNAISRNYKSSEFVGKWKDENSTFFLEQDGSFYIRWDDDKTAAGSWSLVNNILNFNFTIGSKKKNEYYDILYFDGVTLKYQQTIMGVKGSIYNAKKISQ